MSWRMLLHLQLNDLYGGVIFVIPQLILGLAITHEEKIDRNFISFLLVFCVFMLSYPFLIVQMSQKYWTFIATEPLRNIFNHLVLPTTPWTINKLVQFQ